MIFLTKERNNTMVGLLGIFFVIFRFILFYLSVVVVRNLNFKIGFKTISYAESNDKNLKGMYL